MQFELTKELIDDILFAMEDHEGEFMLDTVQGVVVGGFDGLGEEYYDADEDDGEGRDRYIGLPEWDSSDGFRLMEHFAASLKNPMVRGELSSALNQGRGVFRAFKDALGRHPEAEKLWFSFKENEMRREVISWYNGLREEWGLERIGAEPEETDDLLLEDFNFRPLMEEDIFKAEALHRQCVEEFGEKLAGEGAGSSVEIIKEASAFRTYSGPSLGLAAVSSGGEFAGYISAIKKDSVLYVQSLEVKPEFRGLGVGEALLIKFLESCDSNEIEQVLMDLPSWTDQKNPLSDSFSRVLLRESFKPYSVRYWLRPLKRSE